MPLPTPGPVIAIVGSDGAGKSTVGEALLAWLRETRAVEMCHLGKQSGNIGRAIAKWPLIGKRTDQKIHARAAKAQNPDGPGGFVALVIYALSMRRVRRFRRMLRIRDRGTLVLTDRFPQIAVPGPMDGPGLFAPSPKSALTRFLARRERGYYEWMASFPPDLVIRLNVDLETAVARKPDHRFSSLKTKIEAVPRLSFNGAPIVDIDSTLPLDQVLARAKQAITDTLASR